MTDLILTPKDIIRYHSKVLITAVGAHLAINSDKITDSDKLKLIENYFFTVKQSNIFQQYSIKTDALTKTVKNSPVQIKLAVYRDFMRQEYESENVMHNMILQKVKILHDHYFHSPFPAINPETALKIFVQGGLAYSDPERFKQIESKLQAKLGDHAPCKSLIEELVDNAKNQDPSIVEDKIKLTYGVAYGFYVKNDHMCLNTNDQTFFDQASLDYHTKQYEYIDYQHTAAYSNACPSESYA